MDNMQLIDWPSIRFDTIRYDLFFVQVYHLYVCMLYPYNEVESSSVKMLLIGSLYLLMCDNVCT